MLGGRRADFFRQFFGGHPRDHRIMRPARALMLDACAETADSAAILQAFDKRQHLFFRRAGSRGNVSIRRKRIGQIFLDDAQYG